MKEKIKQAFLAQAVADAFCAPYEFGGATPGKVSEALFGTAPLKITDDTQMAMFGLYALGAARRAVPDEGKTPPLDYVRDAYLAWYRTQTDGKPGGTWLEEEPLMRVRRAPGNTCMGSLRVISKGILVDNDSKGNGAVMRTLPFAFAPDLLGLGFADTHLLATSAGMLTHHHRDSSWAVNRYMNIAHALRESRTMPHPAYKYLRDGDVSGDTFTAAPALCAAESLLREALQDGFADERFNRLLLHASLAGGDTDTVAAIAGGLYGLVRPAPAPLVTRLVERPIIERLVEWAVEGGDVRTDSQVQREPAASTGG